jgi:hypothetical protein
MNDAGDVVGYQWIEQVPFLMPVPVRWDLDAWTATDLSPTWGRAVLLDINDAGTVIGQARFGPQGPGSIVQGAILRPGEATPTALGAGSYSFPISINEDEVVAGYQSGRAFRWEAATGVVWLTADGDSFAWDIDERGQIVGQNDGRATLYVGPDPLP